MTRFKERYSSIGGFIEDFQRDVRNIALCSSSFSGKGGASRVVEQQAKELEGEGYTVTIFALEADIEPPSGVELEVVGRPQTGISGRLYRLLYPLTFGMVRSIRALESHDLVISHRYPATVVGYVASRLHSDLEYVYWFHHVVDPSRFTGLASVWIRVMKYLELYNYAVTGADVLCAVSNSSKEKLEEATGRSPVVVPNSIDTQRFSDVADFQTVEEKFDLDCEAPMILFVGRITEQKNIHSLIDVYREVIEQAPTAQLVIVGSFSDDSYKERLTDIAPSGVTFTGYVPDTTLGALYQMCNVYATCSLSEAWSLPPMEAKHFDRPVVAFRNNESARATGAEHLVDAGNYEEFRKAIVEEFM